MTIKIKLGKNYELWLSMGSYHSEIFSYILWKNAYDITTGRHCGSYIYKCFGLSF